LRCLCLLETVHEGGGFAEQRRFQNCFDCGRDSTVGSICFATESSAEVEAPDFARLTFWMES